MQPASGARRRPRATRRAVRLLGLLGLLGTAALLADCGILGNLRSNPGYAAFGSPGGRDTDRHVAVSLGPLPLKLARLVTRSDPELAAALKGVKAVRVYDYEIDGDGRRVRERMEAARDRLLRQGWRQCLAVREDGGLVTALVRMRRPGTLLGMAVIVDEQDELTLVNVIGDLQPEAFGALMAKLDIPRPDMAVSSADHAPGRAVAATIR